MDEKLNLNDNGPIWILNNIKVDFQRLYDHYRKIVNENEHLREENERIKSETYKDEELARLKKEYDQMSNDYYRGFPISEEEDKKINEWIKKQMEKHPGGLGAIGGRFIYEFIPTGIGTSGTIKDSSTGDTFNFQELG